MLRLITEGGVPENPTIPLRWCIDPSDRAKLLQVKAVGVHVLIVVSYKNGVQDRQVRLLEEGMTYVGFRFPGKHTVYARLVWPDGIKDVKKMVAWFLERKNSRQYENDVTTSARSEEEELKDYSLGYAKHNVVEVKAAEPIEVVVDAGHFAKEPPEWLKWWVNLMHDGQPIDQCQFRQRMIVAFTVKPIVVAILGVVVGAIYGLAYLAVLIAGLLLTARGLTLRPIWEWGALSEIWPPVDIDQKYGRIYRRRSTWMFEDLQGNFKPWRVLVSPIPIGISLGAVEYWHRRLELGYVEVLVLAVKNFGLWVSLGIISNFWAIAIVVGIGALLLVLLWQIAERKTEEYLARLSRREEEKMQQGMEREWGYLSCPITSQPAMAATLQALPRSRRTLRLRYYDFKREVCRPFAR